MFGLVVFSWVGVG